MESASKRSRVNDYAKPNVNLHKKKARNDRQLKSTFEHIFQKYGRNFDGIGDEIDLESGQVIVDNGHLVGMKDERDAGEESFSEEEGSRSSSSYRAQAFRRQRQEARRFVRASSQAVTVDVPKRRIPTLGMRAMANRHRDADFAMPPPSDIPRHQGPYYLGMPPDARRSSIERLNSFQGGPAIDPVWSAPPLPPRTPQRRPYFDPPSPSSVAESTWTSRDDGGSGSLWAIDGMKRSSKAVGLPKDGTIDGWHKSFTRWTKTEEETLRYIKLTTEMKYSEFLKYFPGKTAQSLATRWRDMKAREKRLGIPPVTIISQIGPHVAGSPAARSAKKTHSDSPIYITKAGQLMPPPPLPFGTKQKLQQNVQNGTGVVGVQVIDNSDEEEDESEGSPDSEAADDEDEDDESDSSSVDFDTSHVLLDPNFRRHSVDPAPLAEDSDAPVEIQRSNSEPYDIDQYMANLPISERVLALRDFQDLNEAISVSSSRNSTEDPEPQPTREGSTDLKAEDTEMELSDILAAAPSVNQAEPEQADGKKRKYSGSLSRGQADEQPLNQGRVDGGRRLSRPTTHSASPRSPLSATQTQSRAKRLKTHGRKGADGDELA